MQFVEPNGTASQLEDLGETVTMKKTYTEMVAEFHANNGAVINGRSNGPEVAALRIGLIIEELGETLAAMREQNVVEAADGLADLLYVIAGTAVSYGLRLPEDMEPALGRPTDRFEPADVARFTRRLLPRLSRVAAALTVAPADAQLAVADLWDATAETAARVWGLPIDTLFREVHRSNMTKTFAGKANTTGGKYPAGVNPKGPGYEPPDVTGVLGAAGWRSGGPR